MLMERRLKLSGVLIILGLIIEAFSLVWVHALAFLMFAFLGGLLMGVGILVYLYSLVSIPVTSQASEEKSAPRSLDQVHG